MGELTDTGQRVWAVFIKNGTAEGIGICDSEDAAWAWLAGYARLGWHDSLPPLDGLTDTETVDAYFTHSAHEVYRVAGDLVVRGLAGPGGESTGGE